MGTTAGATRFDYVTIIRATAEQLRQALTAPEYLRRYHGGHGPESDWKPGSTVKWSMSPEGDYRDYGQVVLESDAPRRLSYTWHNYQPRSRPCSDGATSRSPNCARSRSPGSPSRSSRRRRRPSS
jgi:uncharacterized protein YndB with AHSA1/START domain